MADPMSDRRVRRTRQSLQLALIDLMVEKDFHEITVQDLIDRADVGRSTFYAHFTDKTDLLRSSLAGLHEVLARPAASAETIPGRPLHFSLEMLKHVADQQNLIRAMLGPRRADTVRREIEALLYDVVMTELATMTPDPPRRRVPLDLVARSVVAVFMATMIWWVEGEFGQSPEQIDAAFQRLAYPGARSALSIPPNPS
jgi:AcrR family transcriptional regulator